MKVNAFTQWGKLKRVVIGNADNAAFQPDGPSNRSFINSDSVSGLIPWPKGPKLKSMTKAANLQLDELARLLESEGVETYRVPSKDWTKPIKAPEWQVDNQYCSVCPRDTMITVGNIMITATNSRRDRFFEYEAYHELAHGFWKTDPDSMWKMAPKCTMNDSMYDMEWYEYSEDKRDHKRKQFQYMLKETEIVFDAADFTRTGKHIFGQVSTTTNMAGVEWLHRELSPYGFVVHPLRILYDPTPSHIDCTFVVLRPGLAMINPDRPLHPEDKKFWEDNDWKFITAPEPDNPIRPEFSQSSKWLNMNILVIDEDKVIVEAEEKAMANLLEQNGFTVLPISFRKVFEFGGSIHCSTWDIEREDNPIDLFPNFDINRSKWHNSIRRQSRIEVPKGYSSLEEKVDILAKPALSSTCLKIGGHPVMERWETPYMYALVDSVASSGGHVLEIGFGMGISAARIHSWDCVKKHTIIEINKDIYNNAVKLKKTKLPKLNALCGSWKECLSNVDDYSVDGIFYDPYPSSKYDQHSHQFEFLKAARRKLKIGGRATYCNLTSLGVIKARPEFNDPQLSISKNWDLLTKQTQIPNILQAGWFEDEISFELYVLPVDAIRERDSAGCEYYQHSECLVPVLVKKRA